MGEGYFFGETSLNAGLDWFLTGSIQWLSTTNAEEPNLLTDSAKELGAYIFSAVAIIVSIAFHFVH
jgi:hypothetical protein